METAYNRLSSYLPCYATAYGNGRLVQIFGRVATDRDHCLAVYGSGRLVQIFGRVATDRDRCLAVYGNGI
jgi:hypothetical protein